MPTGEDKLMAVSQQMDELMAGTTDEIRCPYCGRVTKDGQPFCCFTIMRAMNTLFDARDRFRPSLRK